MRWNIRLKTNVDCRLLIACFAATLSIGGCHEFPDVFIDETPPSSLVTTMSAERAKGAGDDIPARRRADFGPIHTEPQDGVVSHGPLWFTIPREMVGSRDEQFAVTVEDYIALPVDLTRLAFSYVLGPLTVALEPPGTIMCSDGRPRRSVASGAVHPFDEERCSGQSTPIDVHEVWMFDVDASSSSSSSLSSSSAGAEEEDSGVDEHHLETQ
jgi:hypothetical protein